MPKRDCIDTKVVLPQEITNYNFERRSHVCPDSSLVHIYIYTWTRTYTYRHCITQKLTNYCYIHTKYKVLVNYSTPHKTPWPPAEAMQADVIIIITDCTSMSWFLLLRILTKYGLPHNLCGKKEDTYTCQLLTCQCGRLCPWFLT